MQKLVLVIDDNDEFREILAELLNLNGFEVNLADSGTMALKLLNERIPDLIMCDIVMSEMGGYEVLNAIRTNKQFRDIPFIFSTALSEKADRLKSELNNVNHYLVKPYNETELIACINKCLNDVTSKIR